MQDERSEIISSVSRLDLKSYDVIEMTKWVMKARRNKERLEREKEKRTIEDAKRGLLPPAQPHPRPRPSAEEGSSNPTNTEEVQFHVGNRLDRPPTYDEGPVPPYEEPLKSSNVPVSDSGSSRSSRRPTRPRRPIRRRRSCVFM